MKEASGEAKDLRGLHDVNQAERITGWSHWWLRKLVRRGSLKAIRVGRQRRLMFSAEAILRLIQEGKKVK